MSIATPQTVNPAQVEDLVRTNARVRLIDVRTPGEFRQVHIPGSENVPLAQLSERGADLVSAQQDVLVLVCASGPRAQEAKRALDRAGAAQAVVLDGGIAAWESYGAEVTRGSSAGPWAMERQVRLVAGVLVLVGVLGSVAYDPLKWIAGFIGAGLTFAALSNTCMMARLLSLLPYNRR